MGPGPAADAAAIPPVAVHRTMWMTEMAETPDQQRSVEEVQACTFRTIARRLVPASGKSGRFAITATRCRQ